MRRFAPTLLLAAMLLPAGCQPKYTQPVLEPTPQTPEQQSFDRLWQAGRHVLISYHFRLDRQDPRAGTITTWPMTGKQFFELWRRDAARMTDTTESTLQTIYRAVRVTIRQGRDGRGYEPVVEVLISRSDKPTDSISSTSEAYDMFTKRPKKKNKLTGEQEAAQMVELGNDRALEARLTAGILKEAGQAAPTGR